MLAITTRRSAAGDAAAAASLAIPLLPHGYETGRTLPGRAASARSLGASALLNEAASGALEWRLARAHAAPGRAETRNMRIIGSYVSPYVRKVLACLHLKGLAYEIDPITPFYGNEEFGRLSPLRGI